MTCEDVQIHLHEFRKRKLDGGLQREIGAHLETCVACASADRAEHALDELLEQRLPRHAAPTTLKRRLGLLMVPPVPALGVPMRWTRFVAP